MDEFRLIYEREFNTVWHICLSYMSNKAESEDALQETFLRLMKFCNRKPDAFNDPDIEVKNKKIRAWLIRTAGNVCKDQLKSWWRKREAYDETQHSGKVNEYEHDYMLELIRKLPDKYKIPVYMYYYLGYDTGEIAGMLQISHGTLRSRLSRARSKLKDELVNGDMLEKGGLNNEC